MPHHDGVVSGAMPPLRKVHSCPADAASARARAELAQCLDEAEQLPGMDGRTCEELRQKLLDAQFNLVVAGQFKRGKSSLLNALLGDELLPVGVVPLTSIVTIIRFASVKAARAILQDGSERPISIDELPNYVTERGNPRNAQGIRQVVIDHPSAWLANSVRLVDTPGIGSVYEHNTDVTQQYLPHADAVLFIASVDQPLSRAELEFLGSLHEYADKIFCVLNKIDHLSAAELADSLAFVRERLVASLGAQIPLFAVSARLALAAKARADAGMLEASGFPELEESLRRFMHEEKEQTAERSAGRGLLRILTQVRFSYELEEKLLTAPQRRLDENLAAFGRKRIDVERSSTDHQVLLEADARTLFETTVEPALAEFKRSLQARICAAVPSWYEELAALPSTKLQVALEERLVAEIRSSYDGWLAREDAALSAAFASICERAWSNLQATVDELIRYSSELFAVSFEPIAADGSWRMDSRLHYKFWYEPTSLKILSGSLVLALPKWLARGPIIRRTAAQAVELVEIQAGRIRHDLQERLVASVRDVRLRIASTADAIVARIEAAIESGTHTRRQSEAHVVARSDELAKAVRRTAEIEERVRAACA